MPMLDKNASALPGSIGLCHRRYSIIDTSDAGHQPFFNAQKTLCMVYNGEIYNYVELRNELSEQGVNFVTESDTEVLLAAYEHWGTGAFERLNGFWALAIYDVKAGHLVLSRDRVGKKPLFYYRSGDDIIFASEIKAVRAIVERRYGGLDVNSHAIRQWLLYKQKNLQNESFYANVLSLPAASWAVADQNFGTNTQHFWSLPERRLSEKELPVNSAIEELQELLDDAVKIRLRADVPRCVELSGGMDSSTLVALAAKHESESIVTQTVRFDDPRFNEEPFARKVAERYNTDYRVMESPTESFWPSVAPFTFLEEEPYHSPNLQTNQEIWQAMRAEGMKVSLNGAGGDEVFAGYGSYIGPAIVEALKGGSVLPALRNLIRSTQFEGLSARMKFGILHPLRSWLVEHSAIADDKLTRRAGRFDSLAKGKRPIRGSTLSKALRSDMLETKMPYWLCSGDRGTMGVPIETRAPLLDYRVVDLAFSMPISYLIRDGWQKWILRKAMEDLLPEDVVWRRQKLGFPFPLQAFLQQHAPIVKYLLQHSDNPYLQKSQMEFYQFDWTTISFALWYEMFVNDNHALLQTLSDLAMTTKKTSTDKNFSPLYIDTYKQAYS